MTNYKRTHETQRDENAIIGGIAGKKVFVLDGSGNQITSFGGASKSTQPTVTTISGLTTSVTLLSANDSRLGGLFFNDSNAMLYLKLGSGASIGYFTTKIPPEGLFELPRPVFTGGVEGTWDSKAGSVKVTETT